MFRTTTRTSANDGAAIRLRNCVRTLRASRSTNEKGNTGPRTVHNGGAATRFRNCAGTLRASGSRISMMSISRCWSSRSRPSCFATSLRISPISSRRLRNHLAICSSSSDCTKDAYPLQSHLGAQVSALGPSQHHLADCSLLTPKNPETPLSWIPILSANVSRTTSSPVTTARFLRSFRGSMNWAFRRKISSQQKYCPNTYMV